MIASFAWPEPSDEELDAATLAMLQDLDVPIEELGESLREQFAEFFTDDES